LLRESTGRVKAVGGIWILRRSLLKDVKFGEHPNSFGVKGAWQFDG